MTSFRPKVSVVLPTYNRAVFLPATLDTLLGQTFSEDYEIVVADDGSTDGTGEAVRPYAERVRYMRSEHLGLPRIINRGIEQARGEYVMLCNDHDLYAPCALEALSRALDDCPVAALAVSDVVLVDPATLEEKATYRFPYRGAVGGEVFLREQLLPRLGTIAPHNMWRAAALDGEFMDESYGPSSDAELWMRLSTLGDVVHVPQLLVRVRDRDATSELFLANHALVAEALRAKRAYLPRVEDPALPSRIEHSWRPLVDRSAVTALLKLLEANRQGDVRGVVDLVRCEGSLLGRTAVVLLARLPEPVSLLFLHTLRALSRRGAVR